MIRGHLTAAYALHRYIAYVSTGRGDFDPLHQYQGVTHRFGLQPLRHIRCNGVTHRRGGQPQKMTFFNGNGTHHHRGIHPVVCRDGSDSEKGKFIPSITLYAVFTLRTGSDVSAKWFFRTLEDNGYQRRPAIVGDFFESLEFIN